MSRRIRAAALVMLALSAPAALASWSNDPATNLAIADRSGEQVQAKVVPTADGGVYVSWFDNSTGGYDVYLQRIDASGNELWAHNGVLLANRGFSSTQDYDLDIDTSGNALVTFRDDRAGGTQITATKVSPAGVQLWGATGVQLTSGTQFYAAPKIAGTTDGQIVVAWTADADVHLQKLDATGAPQWGAGVTILAIGGDSTSASDMDASDGGGVIISMVRGFMSPKYLYAQKFDGAGAALWGATPLAVFDGGALQTANFPQFVPDGSGGAVFSWYSVAPLQCHAQWVLAEGAEQFGHNGAIVSTAARERTMPTVSFDPVTSSTFVAWREEVGGPFPDYGVYAQKFDSTGTRQWTDEGVVISPLTTTEVSQINQIEYGDGAMIAWVESLAFGNQLIHAARVDKDGLFVWSPDTIDVCSVSSGKSRLTSAHKADDIGVFLWSDARSDANDVYGQTVNADGTLGVEPPGAIPAVSTWGAIAMSLLMIAAGTMVFRGMRARPAA